MKNLKIFSPQQKIIANIDRTIELIKGNHPPPVLIEWDLSNSCMHSCFFCLSAHIHFDKYKNSETFDRSIMQKEKALEIAKDLISIGVRSTNFTGGGESTISPAFKPVLEYIGQNSDIKMGIFTAGVMLDKFDLFESMCKYMEWIRFSIDSGTEETYNRIRVTNKNTDWNKMLSNLSKLIETKKRINSKTVIGTGFVITPDNYTEIIDFANMFKNYDVDYCQYKPEIISVEKEGETQRKVEFWETDIKPLLKQAKEILGDKFQINEYKLNDLIDDPIHFGRHYKKCYGSQLTPCIGAQGEIFVCPNTRGHLKYSYGNVYKRSFIDIWNDVENRMKVMHLIEEKEKFSGCSALCKNHESCKSIWNLKLEYDQLDSEQKQNWENNLLNIEMPKARQETKHWEFI